MLFLVPTLIWGSTWLAITFQLGSVAPEVSVCYRFALAAAVLAAWCRHRPLAAFPARDHAYLAGLGVLMMGFNYIWIYRAEQLITSGLVAVLFSTLVFMSPVAMRLGVRHAAARPHVRRGDVRRDRRGAPLPAGIAPGAAGRRRGVGHRADAGGDSSPPAAT